MIRWRPIPGFPSYEVSEIGEVRNVRTLRVLAMRPSDSGYLKARAYVSGRQRVLFAHRAVLLAFRGPPPTRLRRFGAHMDGNNLNNCLGNLEWKTRRANEADKRIHGTAPRTFTGRDPGVTTIVVVRRLLAEGRSYSSIAREVGLHRHSVSRIARGLRRAA